MRVFVAGGTGVIGRPLLGVLTRAGHQVITMTRSTERIAELAAMGVEGTVCDAFDADRVRDTVVRVKPDVVINQLTSIPKRIRPRRIATDFALNDRLRVEGTANLVRAAVAAGARRLISQSIAFVYAPKDGDGLCVEDDPLFLNAPEPFARGARAVEALERATLHSEDLEGIVLRYGFFYGPGSVYARGGSMADDIMARRIPILGGGTGQYSFIHIHDAVEVAAAFVARGAPGTYNVVDDEPTRVRDWLPALAVTLGAKPPRHIPSWIGRLAAGPYVVHLMTQLRGASNRKLREELHWTPKLPRFRDGIHEALG